LIGLHGRDIKNTVTESTKGDGRVSEIRAVGQGDLEEGDIRDYWGGDGSNQEEDGGGEEEEGADVVNDSSLVHDCGCW